MDTLGNRTVLVVGGGIAGAMSALAACRAGYRVTLLAKGPDPRLQNGADPFSSTFGGEDSRYVTLTEGHPYLGTADYVNQMYPDMQGAFMRSIDEGGWLMQSIERYPSEAQSWLRRRFNANRDHEAIARLFDEYISENRESMRLWAKLLHDCPHLATGISLNSSGVLRLYGSHGLQRMAADFHRRHGVLLDELSASTLAETFPVYKHAAERGAVSGALIVEGLTFRVQQLVKNIFNDLELRGASLRFSAEVKRVELNERTEVSGLTLADSSTVRSDHYTLHLGAYDTAGALESLGIRGEIAGVAGGWTILPKPPGPFLPTKVHDGQHTVGGKLRPVVDLNINPARLDDGSEVLIIGGGYLFVGNFPFEIPQESRKLMLAEIHRVSEMLLGDAFRSARRNGTLRTSERICVRSFTPNDCELKRSFATSTQGVLTIGGGGNTGTTAKAAWVAQDFVRQILAKDGGMLQRQAS